MATDATNTKAIEGDSSSREATKSSSKFSAEAQKAFQDGSANLGFAANDTASKHLPAGFSIAGVDDKGAAANDKGAAANDKGAAANDKGADANDKGAAGSNDQGSVFGNVLHQAELFGEGLFTGSIGNAWNGAKQLVDHVAGIEYKPTEFFSNQKEVDASLAGKIGSMVGTVVDFAALTVASGGALGAVGLAGAGAEALAVGAAGAIEGGVFTPSNDQNFVSGRILNGAIGAAAGVAGFGAASGVGAVAGAVENVAGRAAVRVAGNAGVGAALGAGITEANSLATTGKHASAEQLEFAAAGGAVIGAIGGLGASARELRDGLSDRSARPSESKPGKPDLSNEQILNGMRENPPTFSDKPLDVNHPGEMVPATIDVSGEKIPVLIRAERPESSMAAKFHELTDFNSDVPKTVSRPIDSLGPDGKARVIERARTEGPDGKEKAPEIKNVEVQERIGQLIEDWNKAHKGTADELPESILKGKVADLDPKLVDKLEQAVAERAIIGDNDVIEFNNITFAKSNGEWKVGNIDFESQHGAFSEEPTPSAQISPLAGKDISPSTLSKIDALVSKLETEDGQKRLAEIGLSEKQSKALISRARYLLTTKKFPEDPGFDYDN